MNTELEMDNIEKLIVKNGEKKIALEPVVICSNINECKKTQTHTIKGKAPSFSTLKSVKSGDELLVDFNNMNPDNKGVTTLRNGTTVAGHLKNNNIEVIRDGAAFVRYKVYAEWRNRQEDIYGKIVYIFEA
ncbi:hypothetical protein GLW05_18865 [Pontibacillus yanchengensis]|uniref:Uncharacterized protein n=1 Tax=Pontibacillus yanchengensis TaxID=462910 RepID=A0A6I5A5X6_9BACI|nr:hypothetical protein [Pontibacillus yanchengensis]MYL35642.1 hypothetical protein [Pontibacillus yanchengensis]